MMYDSNRASGTGIDETIGCPLIVSMRHNPRLLPIFSVTVVNMCARGQIQGDAALTKHIIIGP